MTSFFERSSFSTLKQIYSRLKCDKCGEIPTEPYYPCQCCSKVVCERCLSKCKKKLRCKCSKRESRSATLIKDIINLIQTSELGSKLQEIQNDSNKGELRGNYLNIINVDESDGLDDVDELFPMNDVSPITINSADSSILSLQQVTRISDISVKCDLDKDYDSIQIINHLDEKEKVKEEKKEEMIKKENNDYNSMISVSGKERMEEDNRNEDSMEMIEECDENSKSVNEDIVEKTSKTDSKEKISGNKMIEKDNTNRKNKEKSKDVVDNNDKTKEKENKKKDIQSTTDKRNTKDKFKDNRSDNNESWRVNNDQNRNKDYNRRNKRSRSRSDSRNRNRRYRRNISSSRSSSSSSRNGKNRRRRSYSRDRDRRYSRSRSNSYKRRNRYNRSPSRSYSRSYSNSRSRSGSYDRKYNTHSSHSKSIKNNRPTVKPKEKRINDKPPIYKNITPPASSSKQLDKEKEKTNIPTVKPPITPPKQIEKPNLPSVKPPTTEKENLNITVVKPIPTPPPKQIEKEKPNTPTVKPPELKIPVVNQQANNLSFNRGELLPMMEETESESQDQDNIISQSAFTDFIKSAEEKKNQLRPIIDDPLFNNNNNNSDKHDDSVDYTTIDWKVPLYAPCRPGESVNAVKLNKPEEPKKIKPLNIVVTDNNIKGNDKKPFPSQIPIIQPPPPPPPLVSINTMDNTVIDNNNNNNNNRSYPTPLPSLIPQIDQSYQPPPPPPPPPIQLPSLPSQQQQQYPYVQPSSFNNNDYDSGVILDPRLNMTNQQHAQSYAIFSGIEKTDAEDYCNFFNISAINADTPYIAFQSKKVNISYVFVHSQLIKTCDYKNQFGYYCYLLSENCRLLSYKYLEDSFMNKKFLDPVYYLVEPPHHCLKVFSDQTFQVERFEDDNSIKIMLILGGGIVIEPSTNENKRSKACIRVVRKIDGVKETLDNIVTERHVRRCIKHPESNHI